MSGGKSRLQLVLVGAALLAGAAAATLILLEGNSSAPPEGRPPRPSANVFTALRARPLREPRLRPKASCPDPIHGVIGLPASIPAEGALGTGPVHPVSRAIPRFLDFFPAREGDPLATSRWRSNETMWLSEPRYLGPVLVRGRMVRSLARVGFGGGLQPDSELLLPAGAWDEAKGTVHIWGKTIRPPKGWRVQGVSTRVRGKPIGESCYFFQVDGESFSETILFGVIVQP